MNLFTAHLFGIASHLLPASAQLDGPNATVTIGTDLPRQAATARPPGAVLPRARALRDPSTLELCCPVLQRVRLGRPLRR